MCGSLFFVSDFRNEGKLQKQTLALRNMPKSFSFSARDDAIKVSLLFFSLRDFQMKNPNTRATTTAPIVAPAIAPAEGPSLSFVGFA